MKCFLFQFSTLHLDLGGPILRTELWSKDLAPDHGSLHAELDIEEVVAFDVGLQWRGEIWNSTIPK